jgi:hypothetical protein
MDQQGHALSYQTGKVGHALSHLSGKVGRALSYQIRQSWACPSKRGAPFPIYQTVCQELRMDGGIAKPGPACRCAEPDRDSSPILSFSLPTFPVRSSSGARFLHV